MLWLRFMAKSTRIERLWVTGYGRCGICLEAPVLKPVLKEQTLARAFKFGYLNKTLLGGHSKNFAVTELSHLNWINLSYIFLIKIVMIKLINTIILMWSVFNLIPLL